VRRVRGVRSTTRGGRLKVASEPILAALDVAVVDRTGSAPNVLSDYWMLTKPEVNLLIGITTGSALWIGAPLLPRGCVPEYAVSRC
jgi:heme O synthase-like polyprenyltransferase